MAEQGFSGQRSLSSDVRWLSASDSSELQQMPCAWRGPEQALTSAPSSMGECVDPDMTGPDSPLQAGDQGRSEKLLQSRASPLQAAGHSGFLSLEASQPERADASCRARQSSAGGSVQDVGPRRRPPLLSPDSPRWSLAQPAIAQSLSTAGLQCSSNREDLGRSSSGQGSLGATHCRQQGTSNFWEASAAALPGQATPSPLPCRSGAEALSQNPATRRTCPHGQGPHAVLGEETTILHHQPMCCSASVLGIGIH